MRIITNYLQKPILVFFVFIININKNITLNIQINSVLMRLPQEFCEA